MPVVPRTSLPCLERPFYQCLGRGICQLTRSVKGLEKYGDFASQNYLDGLKVKQ